MLVILSIEVLKDDLVLRFPKDKIIEWTHKIH